MKLIDLSHPLRNGQAPYPGDPPLLITPHSTIASDGYNLSQLQLGSHQGTHMDALAHFYDEGRTVDCIPLEWCYGPAHLLRLPREAGQKIDAADFTLYEPLLTAGARIVFETGWHRHYGTAAYFDDPPWLTLEAAHYLASRKLRLLGMDTPTPGRDWQQIHLSLLAPDTETVLIENLTNLDRLPDSFIFIGFPLNIAGGDGSPLRAVGLIDSPDTSE